MEDMYILEVEESSLRYFITPSRTGFWDLTRPSKESQHTQVDARQNSLPKTTEKWRCEIGNVTRTHEKNTEMGNFPARSGRSDTDQSKSEKSVIGQMMIVLESQKERERERDMAVGIYGDEGALGVKQPVKAAVSVRKSISAGAFEMVVPLFPIDLFLFSSPAVLPGDCTIPFGNVGEIPGKRGKTEIEMN
ncbi:hypothetical protein RUM43_011752 [Polyplax serrata]|uniref:Uncharacterized protein n=1 Tax=Polyplax serrata TaxID=468196 RepID=A0AAN8P5T8_POLSC